MSWSAEHRREVRAARRAGRRCVDCDRRLVAGERERCEWCAQRTAAAQRRYRRSARGRRVERARIARRYQVRIAARLCRRGCGAPAAPGRRACERHLEADKVAAALRGTAATTTNRRASRAA